MYKIDITNLIFFCIIEFICLDETIGSDIRRADNSPPPRSARQNDEVQSLSNIEPDEVQSLSNIEPDEVQSLSNIEPDEAAPLILFKAGIAQKLYLPTSLITPSFEDGKMIARTQFAFLRITEQMFFCPNENEEEKCLVNKTFETNDRLRCAKQAPLIIESEELKCGDDETGTFYKALYQICESDVHKFNFGNSKIRFYRICYDNVMQKTLFTIHIIISPELLKERFLRKERKVVYRMIEKDEFAVFRTRGPDDMEIEEDAVSRAERSDAMEVEEDAVSRAEKSDAMEVEIESTSSYDTTKVGYEWQKLVPSEDMAFALWRKTTFQRTNTALQHEKLIKLWDKIAKHIRSNAAKSFTEDKLKTFVYTGVFDLYPAQRDDNQLSNVWVKLILTTRFKFKVKISTATHGLAILMNNFIDTETSSKTISNLNIFEEYCGENLCLDTLSTEFHQINGKVHCCVITERILNLFNEQNIRVKELHIPNVNVTEDQEIFYDDHRDLLTDEEAARRIREIQPNEVLPLILFSNPDNLDLQVPKQLKQIQTKNKRIVSGSEFIYEQSYQQIFFCPEEDTDENCFAPREFGRFEPLQCTKQLTPIARQLEPNPNRSYRFNWNKCGVGFEGILYEVVYEICPMKEPYKYRTNMLKLYEFCYDPARKIILYARYKILSENIINSKLLFWERNAKHQMLADPTLLLSNLRQLEEANQRPQENESLYTLQKLVPSEDMTFGLWQKTTFQYYNVALQHKQLSALWNDINSNIRLSVYTTISVPGYDYNYADNLIYSGVLYKEPSPDDTEVHEPEIWFKVIHSESTLYRIGLVILMQNSLIPKNNQSKAPENSEKNPLDKYCEEKDYCKAEFLQKFDEIGGRVRCCRWSVKIAEQLGISFWRHTSTLVVTSPRNQPIRYGPVISIPNITNDTE